MPRAGPRKVQRYSLEFKLKAVKLSQLRGVEVQAVADALEIHPFMLSRWRKRSPGRQGYHRRWAARTACRKRRGTRPAWPVTGLKWCSRCRWMFVKVLEDLSSSDAAPGC